MTLQELKPKLTDEFLSTLVLCARAYGWSGDYTEIEDFVGSLHEIAGYDSKKLNLEPFE